MARLTPRDFSSLIGQVTGHPLNKGRMIMTSPLCFAAPEGNGVCTLPRYSRLGPPANPGEPGLISSVRITTSDAGNDEPLEDEA